MTDHYYPSNEAVSLMMEADAKRQFELMSTQSWGEYVNAPSVFWRRSLYDSIGGFDISYKYTEDWPTWLRLTSSGIRITSIDEITTIYRYGGISSVTDNNLIKHDFAVEHFNECIRMLKEIALPELEKKSSFKKVIRCKQIIRCIEIRRDDEFEWSTMGAFEQLLWKIKNSGFLLMSLLYRIRKNGVWFNNKNLLIAMGIAVIMFYFHSEFWPGMKMDLVWVLLFLISALILVCRIVLSGVIRSINTFLNSRNNKAL